MIRLGSTHQVNLLHMLYQPPKASVSRLHWGGHYSRSGVPQGVACLVDNTGKPILESHKFVGNSSIFKIQKSNFIILFFLNDCVDCIFCANVVIYLAGDIRTQYFMAGCRYLSCERKNKRQHNSFCSEMLSGRGLHLRVETTTKHNTVWMINLIPETHCSHGYIFVLFYWCGHICIVDQYQTPKSHITWTVGRLYIAGSPDDAMRFNITRFCKQHINDCPCGVWCHGLTTCLVYVCPLVEQQLICTFGIGENLYPLFYSIYYFNAYIHIYHNIS